MSFTPANIQIPQGSAVYVAPVGTAVPTSPTTAFASPDWVDVGNVDDSGATVKYDRKDATVGSWFSKMPVKHFTSSMDLSVMLTLNEISNPAVMPLMFSGATWQKLGTTPNFYYRLDVSSLPQIDERAFAMEWTDDRSFIWRMFMPRCKISDVGDLKLVNTAEAGVQFTFDAMPVAGSPAAYVQTNAPGLAA